MVLNRIARKVGLRRSSSPDILFREEDPEFIRSIQHLQIDFFNSLAKRESANQIFELFLSKVAKIWPDIRVSIFLIQPGKDIRYRFLRGKVEISEIQTLPRKNETLQIFNPRPLSAGNRRERKLWSEPIQNSKGFPIGRLTVLLPNPSKLKRSEVRWLQLGATMLSAAIQQVEHDDLISQDKQFLQTILDISPTIIFAKDRLGKYVFVNQTLADFYSIPIESCINATVDRFHFDPKQCQEFTEEDRRIFETGEEIRILDQEVFDGAGEKHLMTVVKRGIRNQLGEITHIIGVSLDNTELHKLEQEKRKLSENLKDVQRKEDLGRISAGMAHDLNNMLLGILGSSELLLMDELSEESSSHVSQIQKSAHSAAHLIRELLYLSGEGRKKEELISLAELVRKIIDKTSHASRNTQLVADLHPGQIIADKNQIEVLTQHLILNAFEAVPCEGGKITVRVAVQFASENYLAESLTPGRFETGAYLALEISDNGYGISKETREKIFQPFFSSKPLHRGLGLAVADGIIRRHNAALLLSSEEGKGTTIRVLFPNVQG